MLKVAAHDDPYVLISLVEAYLESAPDDGQVRALAVAALVKKGLASVAMELIRACPPTAPQYHELQSLIAQLGRFPPDSRSWTTTNSRFAANLRALSSRGEEGSRLAEEIRCAWEQIANDLTLYQANDGNWQVRGKRSDGNGLWLPAALDFAGKVETVPGADTWRNTRPNPFLLDGVGAGLLLPRLHAASCGTFLNYSPLIFVVETNLRALAVVLRVRDWVAPLQDERVRLFTGQSAWEDWQSFMLSDEWTAVPVQVIQTLRWPGQTPSNAEQYLEAVRERRALMHAEHHRRATEVYAGRDHRYWASRYETAGPDRPLRVLGVTSRFTTFLQHSMRDTLAAMERAGMVTRLLIETQDNQSYPQHAILAAIAEFQPDLLLMIDHHRNEQPECFISDVPFVCWIQDDLAHLFGPKIGRALGPLDFTIGYGLTRCVLQCGYPRERFMPCRVPFNPDKFLLGDDTETDSVPECDVVYISHHSEPPEALHERIRKQASEADARQLVDAFYEETRSLLTSSRFNGSYDLDRLLRTVEDKVGVECQDLAAHEHLMSTYVNPLVDRTLRHVTLAWAADWADATGRKLHIYGRGWEAYPRFQRYAQGPARHGRHLSQIARRAAINLHTGLVFAWHQRVLETLASSGFLLVRYNPFDFYQNGETSFAKYLADHGIDRPTRIPFSDLPADYVEDTRRISAITGREMPEHQEVTAEYLLEQASRRNQDLRYYLAGLAFPDLERITFDGPEAFARQAEYYLAHPEERQAITARMKSAAEELFQYDGLVKRMMAFLTRSLRSAAERPAGIGLQEAAR